MRLRVVPSAIRWEYLPVRSTAAYLPLTVLERTTRTDVNVAESLGLLRRYSNTQKATV
jgi:hypothetical protein